MISVTQRPATVFSISKYFLYIKRGGGGYPPPPLTSFFQVGGTLPPMCRASSGYPLPLRSPAGQPDDNPPKTQNPSPHAGDSMRNTDFGHAEKEPVACMGGGGYPPPPPTSFFQVGYTLPPMCRASSGYPPPPAGPHGGSHPLDCWDGPPMTGVSPIFKSP